VLCLAQLSRPARAAIRLLWIAGTTAYALFVATIAFGPEIAPAGAIEGFMVSLFLIPAALCILRAALVREERFAWAVFGLGMFVSALAWTYYYLVVQNLADPPYPSLADILWLAYYVGAVLGLLALMRARVRCQQRGYWIDAAVGGLAIAALAAALLVEPILAATGGRLAAVITNMAYPLFDVLIVSVVLGVFVMTGWRPGRGWLLLGAVFAVQAGCDTIYLYQTAAGTYQSATWLDASWPALNLLVAVAAWQRPAAANASQTHGWPAVALTAGFALVGLGLMAYDHWQRISDVALGLATLTLIVAFVRTAMTFGEMRSLADDRALHTELILNAAGEGICGLDRHGLVTFANPEAAALTGHGRSELIGRHFHDTVHHSRPDGSPYPFEDCPVASCLHDGAVHHADDDTYWTKDGSSFDVEFTSTPVMDLTGVTGAVVVFKDVTARKRAETALAANERRTRQILETAHDAFVAMDADGLITDWNARAETIFGWSRDEARGRDLSDTIMPERFREDHRRGVQRLLASGESAILDRRLEVSALCRDGREFPIEITITVIQTEHGSSFNAFIQDVTERKAAEDLLERQRRQLVDAQAVGGFGSWEWDLVTGTIERSDELCRIYGLEPGSHPGSVEAMAPAHPDDRARWQSDVQATLESGAPLSIEFRIVMPDGSVRVMHSRGELVHDEHGTPLRVIGTTQDITERHELERAKDEFTSIVSHELRTPLTSIRGSLGLLESGVLGELPAQGQRMVEIAVQNTDRLVRLIDDILDIERINSGQIDMNPGPCDARELIARASDAVAALAAAANVSVLIDAEPVHFSADGDRVIQTLTNLISNAVKFSPPASSVRVSCSRRDGEVLFEVSDEGRGIPAENVETVFGRFQQVDASDSREKGGTGLGLAICRSIVDQHGGRIWAHSVPGHGATFSFLLPAPVGDVADRGPST